MIGTIYRLYEPQGDLYILIDVMPREDTVFTLQNMRTLDKRKVSGWGLFYKMFKPITEEI
jgi:hypothetical protein